MDRDSARRAVRESWRQIIPGLTGQAKDRVNGETSWICPFCGHGTHGDGLTFDPRSRDGNGLKCFGCGWSGDIIDMYMKLTGQGHSEALSRLAQEIGVRIDGSVAPGGAGMPAAAAVSAEPRQSSTARAPGGMERKQESDYTAFFKEANQHLQETDYHRGISLATLNRFGIGFVAAWRHPKALAAVPASPRLIVPTSSSSYLARDTRQPIPPEAEKYAKSKVGQVHIFNAAALATSDRPVFIVEGEFDALSIIDVGGAALALGSVSNWKRLMPMIKENAPTQPLILSLDNDDAGHKAEDSLAEALAAAGIFFYRCQVAAPHKDANAALNADRPAFAATVAAAAAHALDAVASEREAHREELEKEAAAYSLQTFLDQIAASSSASYIPTGFSGLDVMLDGGLFAGLYVVGAISSLGKTTFCLQIADQIAAAGRDVLIFSLEMDRNELIAKSVSRLTVLQDIEKYDSTAHAKTTRGILTGSRYASYSRTEQDLIQTAVTLYGQFATRIYITVGVGDVGVKEIRERVERHVKTTGRAPVVIIDYLQIIAPADIRATDKQNTDKAVLELKRLSRDYKIPVVGISSLNRDNYTEPISMRAFKESGAIEYSSDVLIGLQYMGMDYCEGESQGARDKRIRGLLKENISDAKEGKAQKIQIKILKNRNGVKGEALLDFYPMFNYFKDSDVEDLMPGPKKARY